MKKETYELRIKNLKERLEVSKENIVEAHRIMKEQQRVISQKDRMIESLLGEIARLTPDPVLTPEEREQIHRDIAKANQIRHQMKDKGISYDELNVSHDKYKDMVIKELKKNQ